MTDYVHASGSGAVTLPSSSTVKVPVSARYGNTDYIIDGRFVCDQAGIWRFDLKGWGDGGQLRISLVDDSGAEIDFVSYPGSSGPTVNNPIETSYTILEMAVGDKAWLAVNQASGSTKVITAAQSAKWMMLTATYLGAD